MNAIALSAIIRCHHGIALVGGFGDHSPVEHDGTSSRRGQSLACDDEAAKARKRAQAREQDRIAAASRDSRTAGARSTHAAPMSRQERINTYQYQTGGGLTDRQWRRLNKKARRNPGPSF